MVEKSFKSRSKVVPIQHGSAAKRLNKRLKVCSKSRYYFIFYKNVEKLILETVVVEKSLKSDAGNALIFIHFLKQRTRAFTKLLVERGDGLTWGAGNALAFIIFLKPRPQPFTSLPVERFQMNNQWIARA